MTLVAVAVQPDHAEILTDTFTWSASSLRHGFSSKITLLPHLDTAVMAQGCYELGIVWEAAVASDPAGVSGFDALDVKARELLPLMWEEVEGRTGERSSSQVLHVGWSADAGRFVGRRYSSEDDFAGTDLPEGVFVHPSRGEPVEVPADVGGWVALGKDLHARYALAPVMTGNHVNIGGDLILSRLERGSATQRRVHTFPTDGEQFRRMMIGSLHPLGQLGPCVCGSGQPYLVCHMRWLEEGAPCPCGSGRAFEDCHRINPRSPQAVLHWRRHAGDYRRTRQELQRTYRQARPGEDPGPPSPRVVRS